MSRLKQERLIKWPLLLLTSSKAAFFQPRRGQYVRLFSFFFKFYSSCASMHSFFSLCCKKWFIFQIIFFLPQSWYKSGTSSCELCNAVKLRKQRWRWTSVSNAVKDKSSESALEIMPKHSNNVCVCLSYYCLREGSCLAIIRLISDN